VSDLSWEENTYKEVIPSTTVPPRYRAAADCDLPRTLLARTAMTRSAEPGAGQAAGRYSPKPHHRPAPASTRWSHAVMQRRHCVRQCDPIAGMNLGDPRRDGAIDGDRRTIQRWPVTPARSSNDVFGPTGQTGKASWNRSRQESHAITNCSSTAASANSTRACPARLATGVK
jgi:hypothetical protein